MSRRRLNDDLRSLGIEPKQENELNDERELEALVDNIKLTYYQDYKTAYAEKKSLSAGYIGVGIAIAAAGGYIAYSIRKGGKR